MAESGIPCYGTTHDLPSSCTTGSVSHQIRGDKLYSNVIERFGFDQQKLEYIIEHVITNYSQYYTIAKFVEMVYEHYTEKYGEHEVIHKFLVLRDYISVVVGITVGVIRTPSS
jgi:hypothetical protein